VTSFSLGPFDVSGIYPGSQRTSFYFRDLSQPDIFYLFQAAAAAGIYL
jgi:hypothetical protein